MQRGATARSRGGALPPRGRRLLTQISERLTPRTIRRALGRGLLYLVLVSGAVVLLVPLAWLLSSAVKDSSLIFIYPPQWIPNPIVWRNFLTVWEIIPFATFLKNTMLITGVAVFGAPLSASFVAFGFARLRFPGRDILFLVLLSTLMIPFHVTLIPSFVLFKLLGWLDSFKPLIIPPFFGGSAFHVFLIRQFMDEVAFNERGNVITFTLRRTNS